MAETNAIGPDVPTALRRGVPMLKISSKKIKQVIIRIQDNAIDWSTTKVSRGELFFGLYLFLYSCHDHLLCTYALDPATIPSPPLSYTSVEQRGTGADSCQCPLPPSVNYV